MKSHTKSKTGEAGQAIGVVIILLALIGVGFWFLFNHRNTMRNEGRAFGRQAIERIIVQHDANFLAGSLGPQAKLDLPPMAQQELMSRLQQLGAPIGPLNVQGDITFESQFFEPRGLFNAQLNYPAGMARVDLSVSHPVGRWQIDTIGVSMGGR
jgi:LPXTG-motif cell wall-anchored protein